MVAGQLDQVATSEADGVYRLDEQKILLALEQGADFAALCHFLARHNQGSLPKEIDAWLAKIDRNSRAFSIKTEALLIQADSGELVQKVLADPDLRKFSRTLDDGTLVIPSSRKTRFRNRLRELGYGVV